MDQELRSIPELVYDALNTHNEESAFASVVVLAHFDCDFEHYFLVQTWDHFEANPEWRFSLWFVSDCATHLCDFPSHKWSDRNIPYIAAVEMMNLHKLLNTFDHEDDEES